MDIKDITVIITTFKSENKLYPCLNSIPESIKILVIENSDNEELKKKINLSYPNVECILTGSNMGYSVANNIGLSKVTTEFALVLNPDTLVEKDTFTNFLKAADQFPDFWLMGPANHQSRKKIATQSFLEVENIKGFAIFFNMKKFQNKFFDENYFLYFEEIDLCKRVKIEKGKIYVDPKINIHHDGAKSVETKTQHELEKNRNWHWMWSTFYFHKKYKGFLIALIIILPKLISSFLKIIFFQLIFNLEKREIYLNRLSGLINSILGRKSWRRPTID